MKYRPAEQKKVRLVGLRNKRVSVLKGRGSTVKFDLEKKGCKIKRDICLSSVSGIKEGKNFSISICDTNNTLDKSKWIIKVLHVTKTEEGWKVERSKI